MSALRGNIYYSQQYDLYVAIFTTGGQIDLCVYLLYMLQSPELQEGMIIAKTFFKFLPMLKGTRKHHHNWDVLLFYRIAIPNHNPSRRMRLENWVLKSCLCEPFRLFVVNPSHSSRWFPAWYGRPKIITVWILLVELVGIRLDKWVPKSLLCDSLSLHLYVFGLIMGSNNRFFVNTSRWIC